MSKNVINLDVKRTLRDLAEKHNQLAVNVINSSTQLTGNLDVQSKQVDYLTQQNLMFQAQNKVLTFHLNKLQAELAALRQNLVAKGVNLDDFKQYADNVFKLELGIDSEYIPVGCCVVNYYN